MDEYEDGNPMVVEKVKVFIRSLFMSLYNNETSKVRYLYFTNFSQLTESYYKEDEWPAIEEIDQLIRESELFKDNEDDFDIDKYDRIKDLFTFLYTELCYRHIFVHGKPLIHHRVQSFDNYVQLFEFFLTKDNHPYLPNLPIEWIADMMDEYLYQFEDFCSFRHQLADLKEEELQDLEIIEDAANETDDKSGIFEVKQALNILQTLSLYCDFVPKKQRGTLWNLGYVATLAISRIHVLLADYSMALETLNKIDLDDKRGSFAKLTSLHVTLFYYTGFAYLMLGRYVDAVSLFSNILLAHRAIDRVKVRTVCYADTQFQRKYEKIRTLCTIAATLNFSQSIEDNLKNILSDNRSQNNEALLQKLKNVVGTENVIEKQIQLIIDAFKKSCPRFITPQKPDYTQIENRHKETADIQVKWFSRIVEAQLAVPDLKTLLQIYSSISIQKLAELSQMSEEKVLRDLIQMKCRSQQLRREIGAVSDKQSESYSHLEGKYQVGSDIHFFIKDEMVFIDDKQKKQKFADFFLQNAVRLGQCAIDLQTNTVKSHKKGNYPKKEQKA